MKTNKSLWISLTSAILVIFACHPVKKADMFLPPIQPTKEYVLMAINPELSISTTDIAIHKQYLSMSTRKKFPVAGFLRVNGKLYRFMGDDYLRARPLFALAHDSCGWDGKYTFLNPGIGWEQEQFDDAQWQNGKGAFGSENTLYPIHTSWNAHQVYVRRHVSIDDINILKEHKMYIHYICDDRMIFYLNGQPVLQAPYTSQIERRQLSEDIVGCLHNGENVIAVQGIDEGIGSVLDFGLYIEDKTYHEADTAFLKQVDVQATQTHYVFQCDSVNLQLDFVSPAWQNGMKAAECPVGFITYQVESVNQQAEVEIIFDVDAEWMFNEHRIDSVFKDKWKIAKINDRFFLGMEASKTTSKYTDGHIVISQQLHKDQSNSGVLLLAYNEGSPIQYEGENLSPYWSRKGKGIEEIIVGTGNQYKALLENGRKLDTHYYDEAIRNKGKKYATHTILNYRNFGASHRFVASSRHELFCFGNSLGNIREIYTYFPTLLFYNRIDCMKGLLNPIFEYSESVDWPKKYPPYDMGNYPIVSRQVNSEDHGAEVAADMLVMTLAIVKKENDFGYAEKHWKALCQWADYLKGFMADTPAFSYEFPSANHERIVLGWMAYQELLQLK